MSLPDNMSNQPALIRANSNQPALIRANSNQPALFRANSAVDEPPAEEIPPAEDVPPAEEVPPTEEVPPAEEEIPPESLDEVTIEELLAGDDEDPDLRPAPGLPLLTMENILQLPELEEEVFSESDNDSEFDWEPINRAWRLPTWDQMLGGEYGIEE